MGSLAEGLADATNPDGSEWFRPLGGGIDPGETGAAAVERELMEELGEAIVDIEALGVLEDIYSTNDDLVHEIVLVYRASWARPDPEGVRWIEAGEAPSLRWIERYELPLLQVYPPGLVALIERTT